MRPMNHHASLPKGKFSPEGLKKLYAFCKKYIPAVIIALVSRSAARSLPSSDG